MDERMDERKLARDQAVTVLEMLAQDGLLPGGTAIELARLLCHISGGDGRGVFEIVNRPWGDEVTETSPEKPGRYGGAGP